MLTTSTLVLEEIAEAGVDTPDGAHPHKLLQVLLAVTLLIPEAEEVVVLGTIRTAPHTAAGRAVTHLIPAAEEDITNDRR